MERDEILKALKKWINNFDGKMINFITLANAYGLIEKLTEENERLKAEKIAALDTFAEKLKRYYNALNGRTPAVLVAYHIDQIKQEMTKTDQKCD